MKSNPHSANSVCGSCGHVCPVGSKRYNLSHPIFNELKIGKNRSCTQNAKYFFAECIQNDEVYICKICESYLFKKQIPPFTRSNGFNLPLFVPEELRHLTPLEKMMISPIIIHQKIFKVKGGFHATSGNCISLFSSPT